MKDIRDRFARLCADRGIPCAMRISVHFGELVFGSLPPFELPDVTGDAVNQVFLQQHGVKSSGIILSAQAWRLVNPRLLNDETLQYPGGKE